jgi:hypothetical protein
MISKSHLEPCFLVGNDSLTNPHVQFEITSTSSRLLSVLIPALSDILSPQIPNAVPVTPTRFPTQQELERNLPERAEMFLCAQTRLKHVYSGCPQSTSRTELSNKRVICHQNNNNGLSFKVFWVFGHRSGWNSKRVHRYRTKSAL